MRTIVWNLDLAEVEEKGKGEYEGRGKVRGKGCGCRICGKKRGRRWRKKECGRKA